MSGFSYTYSMNKKNAHLAGIHRCMSTHEPILQQRESQLNESLHVFDGIDEKYHDKISDAADKLIAKLYNGNTIPYIKRMRREYAKYTITDILPKIKECNVYVGINSNMEPDSSDAILISYNDMNDAEVFIDIEQPVVIFEDGIYERIALRIEIDRYTAANKIKLKNSIESSITHELMHMYHQCKKESLTNNSGNAYYHANMIFELLNMDFPQKQDIINDNMLPIVYYPLLMYFCADSELSAWM